MTILVRLAKRAPGLPIEIFQRTMPRNTDLLAAEPFGLRAATQALTLPGAYRRGEPVYDVIDELHFDGVPDARACLAGCDWTDELLDPASIALLVVEPHVAKEGPVPETFVKNYEVVTKRPGMDRAEFDRYWTDVHGPIAARIPTIRRYEQYHLAPGTSAPFDGLAVTWWDGVDAMRAGTQTEFYGPTRADEANFLAGELPFVITTERRIRIGART